MGVASRPTGRMSRLAPTLALVALASPALALEPLDKEALRRTTLVDLTPRYERHVLPNGLVVLLDPDPTASGVVVDQSFFAGTVFEPPRASGLAHLVEHLMVTGRTGETDYEGLLASRGAWDFNALTTPDVMTFRVVVPPHELPLALWVAADRLGTLPAQLDDAELARHRRIVLEERALRVEDVAYGNATAELFRSLFAAPHPLHGMVIGTPDELASISAAEARAYIGRYLVPANGVLTLVGRFDPAVARDWVERTVGRLPPGARAEPPQLTPRAGPEVTASVPEPRSRRPRVTFAWRFGELPRDTADALEFGAQFLALYTDGAFGIDVDAGFEEFLGGGLFRIDVTMAHDKSKQASRDDAEGLLRYLTRAPAPDDLFAATLLAWDRLVMLQLDSPRARAALLLRLERSGVGPDAAGRFNERHWTLHPFTLQPVARKALDAGRYTLHARPLHARPPRKPRE